MQVVASFHPMQYLATEIGGSHVSVSNLTKPGIEPHDMEISPQQTAELGEADMIVYLKDLQPAVDEAIEQSGVKNTVDTAGLTKLDQQGDEHAEEHGDEHAEEQTSMPKSRGTSMMRAAPTRTSGSTR